MQTELELDRVGERLRWKWMQNLPQVGTEIEIGGAKVKFTRTDYAVACFIAARINAKNPDWPLYQAWPDKKTIAEKLGLDVRSVRRSVARLEAFGLIHVRRGGIFTTPTGGKIKLRNLYAIRTPESDLSESGLPSPGKRTPESAKSGLQSHPIKRRVKENLNKDSDFQEVEESEILSIGRHAPEDVARWRRMLSDEREHGCWRFEREPKSTIPADVRAKWERENPLQ